MERKQCTVLVIDDDPVALEQSRSKIALYVPPEKIFTAENAVEVMRILKSVPVDLVFIDMELPDTDGFSLADYVSAAQPKAKYVFLTGHVELGAKSYEYEPLDFLCKPLDVLRLQKTFDRYERSRSPGRYTKEQIALESTSGFMLISPADVLYITRESRKTVICCAGGSHTAANTLDELELIFSDYGFFRCHQSYLISLAHVTGIKKSEFGKTYTATLDNGAQVAVSRHRYAPLKERLSEYGTQFV